MFARFCRANHLAPNDVHVVATSAIRDAANGAQFLADAERATGLTIETLSAHDEACFGYVAAVNTTTLTDGVVLDIGGGSMQLIHVEDRRAQEMVSFPLGAVRLTEQFLPGDGPAKKKELARLRAHVDRELCRASTGWPRPARAWSGSAAPSATSPPRPQPRPGLARPRRPGIRDHAARCCRTWCASWRRCRSRSAASVPGIKPGRGDIILAAAVVLDTVVELGGFDGIEATEAGLREGVFLARTLLRRAEPLFADVREAAVAQPRHPVRVRHDPRRARRQAVAADVRLARRRWPVQAAPTASASCCGRHRCSTTSG